MSQAVEEMPRTFHRRREQFTRQVDEKVHQRMLEELSYYALRLDQIGRRLDELEREWSVERAVQAQCSTVILLSLGWYILTGTRACLMVGVAMGGVLLNHAITGRAPQMPLLRGLGFRMRCEIEQERAALRGLRGDFQDIPREGDPIGRTEQALRAAGATQAR